MDGDAKGETSTVNLKITAVQQVKADSNGDFSYSYNTKAVPPGDFEISVGGITKKVTLQEEETLDMISDYSSQETETVKEQTPSETQEETEKNTKEVLSKDQDAEKVKDKEVQEPQPVEKTGFPVDTVYMVGGMGAAVLILVLNSKRK
jgi:hypothetical protein